MDLSLKRETKLVLGQKMYESMSFLQMSTEELEQSMEELCLENPMLEQQPPKESRARLMSRYSGRVSRHGGEMAELPIPDKLRRSLKDELSAQALGLDICEATARCLSFLIINIDDRGYLPENVASCRLRSRDPEHFDEALRLLRSMEPAGVGAWGLSDCLCLQLERLGLADSPAAEICRGYLDHLAKNHVNHICRALSLSEAQYAQARAAISSLNPIPSNGFDDGKQCAFVIPDVEIEVTDGEVTVTGLDRYMPTYSVSREYSEMAQREDITPEEREYFKEKLSQATWAINSISRRADTVRRCAEVIAEEQAEFFEFGGERVRPCTMADVADRLGVHPSTVSRAVRDKFISCKWGVFPMSRFFEHEVNGDAHGEIVGAIRYIISREDKRKPLSDAAVAEKLSEMGYEISRRTAAKYRIGLGIPSTAGRRIRC